MKKLYIIIGLLGIIVFVLLFNGMFKQPVNENTIKILIEYGGWGNERCIFEITPDGRLVVNVEKRGVTEVSNSACEESLTFGNSNYATTLDPERTEQRSKKLSKKQQEEIDALIKQIRETGDKFTKDFFSDAVVDAICIYASMDDKVYGSFFSVIGNESDVPNALQELTYKLVDISPLKIEGLPRYNKTRGPQDKGTVLLSSRYNKTRGRFYCLDIERVI